MIVSPPLTAPSLSFIPPQVGLFVSPHQVRQGDRGLVIVGASLELGDVTSGEGLEGVEGTEGPLAREQGVAVFINPAIQLLYCLPPCISCPVSPTPRIWIIFL